MLAPLLGAGKKEGNEFTGVMMGDLKLANGSVTNTGLYGFKEGSRRFSFNDKGEAYIGTGDYYINFNGEDLTIKAKNFDLNANNGALVINDREGIKLGSKISINPDGTAKIGGWNINSSTIYSDTNQWYIQLNSPSAYGDQGVANSQVLQIYDKANRYWPFSLTSDGSLLATKANIKGTITANSGKIGGWHIGTDAIYGGDNVNGKLNLWAPDSTDGWVMAIYIEDGGNLTTPFVLTKQGHLTATKATIRGDITATSGSFNGTITAQNGNIGGWSIGKNYLQGTWGSNYVTIKVPEDGTDTTFLDVKYNGTFPFVVTKTGHLTANDANITGTINAGSIICDDIGFGNSGRTTFKDYSSPSPPYNVGTIWKHKSSSNSYISLDSRDTVISGVEVGLNSQTGTIGFENNDDYASGFINVHYTDSKEHMQIGTGDYIDLMINGSKKLWCKSTGGVLNGTWTTGSSITVTSDINAKNTINPLSDIYSILFDNFRPVTYKYNDGTSNRLHTGFIAQEVYKALQIAGISSQDFAGLIIPNENTDDEFWTLRYEEFIALNTWQIQKLKTRVTELENEIKEIKQRYEI